MHSQFPVLPINSGVVSRVYRWSNTRLAIAYHTPSRSVSIFEDDSAEVWWLLYQDHGDPRHALDYMWHHGSFSDPTQEIPATLASFRSMLEHGNLVAGEGNQPTLVPPAASLGATVSPESNPEQQIIRLMADRHICYSLSLELTYRCNEKCVHCYLPAQTRLRELTAQDIEAILAEFDALGGFQLQLTGGELSVRKDIGEVLDIVRERKFAVSINSNLLRVTEETFGKLVALQPKVVSCSIYSARPELHDGITRVRGSFERSMAVIRRLRKAGIPVAIKTPLLRTTAAHWRELDALAEAEGCGFQMDLAITAKNDGGLSPLEHRVSDPILLQEIFSSNPYRITFLDEPLGEVPRPDLDANICGAGAAGLAISPNGDIRPCIGMSEVLGTYPGQTLAEVWRNSPFFARWSCLTLKDIVCGRCPYLPTCNRCPGAWHAEHGSYTRPTEYNCALARAWSSASQTRA